MWRSCEPCLTTPRWMGWWRGPSKDYADDWNAVRRKKADWPGCLAEIVHTYNATRSTVIEYSSHYLMFGCRPRLPVNFYFPTLRRAEEPRRGTSTMHVDEYIATVWDQLRATLQEAQIHSTAEAQIHKWYYDQKIGTIGFEAMWSCLSQGRCLSREEEDQGQMGG